MLGISVPRWLQVTIRSAKRDDLGAPDAVGVKGRRQLLAQRRGGRLRSPNFAEVLYIVIQHALLPLSRGAADLQATASAADLSMTRWADAWMRKESMFAKSRKN